jgi:hypothetical protein
MSLSQNEILHNTRGILQQVPYRTTFERENFLFSSSTGPRLLVTLCQDIEFLNGEYNKAGTDWDKNAILNEMNKVNNKVKELQAELGSDITQAIEDGEAQFWVEELARKAAVEALCQAVTAENMGQMLKLPADLYEETITKCQTFLNIINKTTRLAERKANVGNGQQAE